MVEGQHFPVVGNSYGMLSMLKSQMSSDSAFKFMDIEQVHAALEQNLLQHPQETFIFDEVEGLHLEALMDHVSFYNEAILGITVGDFDYIRELNVFVPVTSFHNEKATRDEEFVSTFEGTVQPFFGFLNRIDKIQFGFHAADGEGQAQVDHSKPAIEYSRHMANLIVDEARLSPNFFEYTNDETAALISNYDSVSVRLQTPHVYSMEKELHDFYRTEMYFFV
jgi:hypothetical protein